MFFPDQRESVVQWGRGEDLVEWCIFLSGFQNILAQQRVLLGDSVSSLGSLGMMGGVFGPFKSKRSTEADLRACGY